MHQFWASVHMGVDGKGWVIAKVKENSENTQVTEFKVVMNSISSCIRS